MNKSDISKKISDGWLGKTTLVVNKYPTSFVITHTKREGPIVGMGMVIYRDALETPITQIEPAYQNWQARRSGPKGRKVIVRNREDTKRAVFTFSEFAAMFDLR
jgi:hypothetical protein